MITPKYIRVAEGGSPSAYTISTDSVSNKEWGTVNKTAIKNKLEQDLQENVPGTKKAIRELYAVVGSTSDKNTWKYPHHILRGKKIILNKHGLSSAAGYLAQDNSLPSEVRKKAARHLKRHYNQIEQDIPEGLAAVLESATGNPHAEELVDWLSGMDGDNPMGVDDGDLSSMV